MFSAKKTGKRAGEKYGKQQRFFKFCFGAVQRTDRQTLMGEYIIYFRGKVVGGIYDNRFLLKQSAAAKTFLKSAEAAVPYKGAKEMLVLDNLDDRELLKDLLEAMYEELPEPSGVKPKSRA